MAGYKRKGRAVESNSPEMPDLAASQKEPSPGSAEKNPLTAQQHQQITRRVLSDPAALADVTVPTLPPTTANEQIATTRFVGTAIDTVNAILGTAVFNGDAAGGDLTGTYPNPTIIDDVALGGDVTVAGSLEVGTSLTVYDDLVTVGSVSVYGSTSALIFRNKVASGAWAYVSAVTGDAEDEFRIQVGGKQEWGDGTNPTDVFLERTAAGELTVDGTLKVDTPAAADSSTKAATTAYVQGELAAKANLAGPTFTGDPKAPTPSVGDNDTSLATTAFVRANAPFKFYDSTLGSAAASFSVASIPSGYSQMKIFVVGRGDTAAFTVDVGLQFNADTGNNYWWGRLLGNGTGTPLFSDSGLVGAGVLGRLAAASAGASIGGECEITISNYDGTTFYKCGHGVVGFNGYLSAGNAYEGTYGMTWQNTAAISSMVVKASAGNFVTGTRCVVYLYP